MKKGFPTFVSNVDVFQDVCTALEQGAPKNVSIEKILGSCYKEKGIANPKALSLRPIELAIELCSPPKHALVRQWLEQGHELPEPQDNTWCWPEKVVKQYAKDLEAHLLVDNVLKSLPPNADPEMGKRNQCLFKDNNAHCMGLLDLFEERNTPWSPQYTSPSFHRKCWQVLRQPLVYYINTYEFPKAYIEPLLLWFMNHGVAMDQWAATTQHRLAPLLPQSSNLVWLAQLQDTSKALMQQRQLQKKVGNTKTGRGKKRLSKM